MKVLSRPKVTKFNINLIGFRGCPKHFSKFDKSPIFVGITPLKRLLFKFNEVKKDNRPNDDGIVPLR